MNGALQKLLALLRSSAVVAENVSTRYRAVWVPERVEAYKSWEITCASQIEHYKIRVDIDAQMRKEGIMPTMVGFEAMLSGLMEFDETSIELHLLTIDNATFLVRTNVGTTRLIGMLWSFEDGSDPFP